MAEDLNNTWIDYVPKRFAGQVEKAFQGNPLALKLTEELTVYRYWGGNSLEAGSPWYSLDSFMTPDVARETLALPDGNSAINISKFILPKDTVIVLGEASPQLDNGLFGAYAEGGGIQIYVPDASAVKLVGQITK